MSNWTTYHLHNNEYDYPPRPGVYAVYGDGELLYVGQSMNVRKRLVDHGVNFARYSDSMTSPRGQFDELTVKVRRSVRCGDWAMIELRLLNRLQPSGNRRFPQALAS